jgi:hypothetical protein
LIREGRHAGLPPLRAALDATRLRVGLDWALAAVLPRPLVQLGLIREEDASLAVTERTGIYATPPVPLEDVRSAWGRMKGANR